MSKPTNVRAILIMVVPTNVGACLFRSLQKRNAVHNHLLLPFIFGQSKPHQPKGLLHIHIQTQWVLIQSTDCPALLKANWQKWPHHEKILSFQLLLVITLLFLKNNWQKTNTTNRLLYFQLIAIASGVKLYNRQIALVLFYYCTFIIL